MRGSTNPISGPGAAGATDGRSSWAKRSGVGCIRYFDQMKGYKPGHLVTPGRLLTLETLDEVVPLRDGRKMVIDDAGHYKRLAVNDEATRLYRYGRQSDEVIAGDVLVCQSNQINE